MGAAGAFLAWVLPGLMHASVCVLWVLMRKCFVVVNAGWGFACSSLRNATHVALLMQRLCKILSLGRCHNPVPGVGKLQGLNTQRHPRSHKPHDMM